MRNVLRAFVVGCIAVVLGAGHALACGGLVAPNGSINLLRTATLAAYHDGVEHYVTSFEFAGGGAEFGSIVPLPGIPSAVKHAGNWTLQRLEQEVNPPVLFDGLQAAGADRAVAQKAVVLLEKSIGALDITILKGGGDEVGVWAKENGFRLPVDAPDVLDFYAERSPIFMAARFDVKRAAASKQSVGDGTPIHLVIPTPSPWVPLRILTLGRQPNEQIEADVFLLTDERPNLLPVPATKGVVLERSEAASDLLLSDLRSDRGMKWLPASGMHLSFLKIDTPAKNLAHDLAIDPTGRTIPSYVAAGLASPTTPDSPVSVPWSTVLVGLAVVLMLVVYAGRSPARPVL
ncbi:MAG: hypothetical protein QOH90_1602 [Actinomycetota bacterium]|nr:hypothetical protein [Actinomycetota bacterium]